MNEEKPEEIDHVELFEIAMKGHWDKVVEVYQKSSKARTAKLTKSEDTALHLAVLDGHTDIVVKLVDSIPANEASNILEIKNEGGNTPLHIAVIIGNEAMCECIAQKHPNLIAARNAESETPLFLAAHLGRQGVFLCLHELWEKESGQELDYTPCRKSNGDTILHTAIFGECFSKCGILLQFFFFFLLLFFCVWWGRVF
ncbi:uncharacterized protein LOC132273053 [Cornus florida]|uniref:uncharacterized protein LOC132273053 n=1 Tax=Cornus florida TaxID=4283 RepID=UPI002899D4C7|nr:uncharacterized protein LOC132273053 [Cornus florida]